MMVKLLQIFYNVVPSACNEYILDSCVRLVPKPFFQYRFPAIVCKLSEVEGNITGIYGLPEAAREFCSSSFILLSSFKLSETKFEILNLRVELKILIFFELISSSHRWVVFSSTMRISICVRSGQMIDRKNDVLHRELLMLLQHGQQKFRLCDLELALALPHQQAADTANDRLNK